MMDAFARLISGLDTNEGGISVLEGNSTEIAQTEIQTEKRVKKKQTRTPKALDTIKKTLVYL